MKKEFENFEDYCRYRNTGESRVSEKIFKMVKKLVDEFMYYEIGPEYMEEDYRELTIVYSDCFYNMEIVFHDSFIKTYFPGTCEKGKYYETTSSGLKAVIREVYEFMFYDEDDEDEDL